FFFVFFFFQAEDGIRDFHVTGVQTCALPIFADENFVQVAADGIGDIDQHRTQSSRIWGTRRRRRISHHTPARSRMPTHSRSHMRSEERRVGKECSTRWAAYE